MLRIYARLVSGFGASQAGVWAAVKLGLIDVACAVAAIDEYFKMKKHINTGLLTVCIAFRQLF